MLRSNDTSNKVLMVHGNYATSVQTVGLGNLKPAILI